MKLLTTLLNLAASAFNTALPAGPQTPTRTRRRHPYDFDAMKLSPHVSRKLWDILSAAEIAHQLNQADLAQTLRREANRHHGQTRKVLLNIAAHGSKGASRWIGAFIQWMNQKDDTPATNPNTPPHP